MTAVNLKSDLASRPTEELVRELVGLLGYAAEKLQRMAFIVAELESRGHSTAAIRDVFLMRQLRRIAAGDLLPSVVEHFLGNPTVIDAVARLPIAGQKALLDCGKVSVLINHKMESIDLAHLSSIDRSHFSSDSQRSRTASSNQRTPGRSASQKRKGQGGRG